MTTLIVLLGSFFTYRLTGAAGIAAFDDWTMCARWALASMFLFTAAAPFAPMKKDLIAMVPPALPRPDLIVFFTGVLEIAGAAGLLFQPTRYWAALGLILLLLAIFPANASAARRKLLLRGKPVSRLPMRAAMQALYVLWAWWVR